MRRGLDTAIVAPTAAELDLYCDRVAAAVGRLSVRAFGDGSPAADRVAHHLGRALQYTNILRDLGEDARRDYADADRLLGDVQAEAKRLGIPLRERNALLLAAG